MLTDTGFSYDQLCNNMNVVLNKVQVTPHPWSFWEPFWLFYVLRFENIYSFYQAAVQNYTQCLYFMWQNGKVNINLRWI